MRLPRNHNASPLWDDHPGQSRDKSALRFWADRAERNSAIAPRARSGEMRLPDTGGKVRLQSTAAPPRRED